MQIAEKTVEVIPIRQEKETKNAAAYIRVSTGSIEQETSYSFQKEYWEGKLANMPGNKLVGIYCDEGIGGYNTRKRKGLLKLVKDALNGKIDIIYTKSISRFSRNLTDLIQIIQQLADKNIPIIFEKEGINSLNTKASLLLRIQGILAEQEIKNNKQLVELSRRRQFEQGRPYICVMPFGYKQECNPNFVINEDEAEKVRNIYKMYADGWKIKEIIKIFRVNNVLNRQGKNLWSSTAISSILKNEKYVGDVLMQKTYRDENYKTCKNRGEVKQYYIENNHEPIIDRETYIKVQRKFLAKKPNISKTEREEPFRYGFMGKLRCGKCGKLCKHKKRYLGYKYAFQGYWICRTKFQLGEEICDNEIINDEILEELTCSAYQEYSSQADDYIGKLEKRLKEVAREQEELTTLVLKHYINKKDYDNEMSRLREEFTKLDETIRFGSAKKVIQFEKFNMAMLDHIEKIELDGYQLKFYFINGKTMERGYSVDAEYNYRPSV